MTTTNVAPTAGLGRVNLSQMDEVFARGAVYHRVGGSNIYSAKGRSDIWYCNACESFHDSYFNDCPMVTNQDEETLFEDYLVYDPGLDDYNEDNYQYPHTKFAAWMQKANNVYNDMVNLAASISNPANEAETQAKMLRDIAPNGVNINGYIECKECHTKYWPAQKNEDLLGGAPVREDKKTITCPICGHKYYNYVPMTAVDRLIRNYEIKRFNKVKVVPLTTLLCNYVEAERISHLPTIEVVSPH